MVFLFGWTTNLVFFSGMTKQFSVFTLVLETIFKDIILDFLPVFLFTLLGFSFAMHVLSLYSLPPDDEVYLGATFYEVFAASLGSSDYVEDTRDERSLAGIHFELFEFVVIGYICILALILLNVLIAIMSNRYDQAKQRAENFWRFKILRIALDLEMFTAFRYRISSMPGEEEEEEEEEEHLKWKWKQHRLYRRRRLCCWYDGDGVNRVTRTKETIQMGNFP